MSLQGGEALRRGVLKGKVKLILLADKLSYSLDGLDDTFVASVLRVETWILGLDRDQLGFLFLS